MTAKAPKRSRDINQLAKQITDIARKSIFHATLTSWIGQAHCESAAGRTRTADPAPHDGFLFLDRAKFAASFAADVEGEKTAFMADSQVPWGLEALEGAVSEPAWRTKPSWYLVATDDKMVPPAAQRFMSKRAGSTVVESAGSHAIYVSWPEDVASIIKQAAQA